MNIAATKIELAREILSIEDESVLKKIEDILSSFYTDKQTKPKVYPMTMDELNARIDAAEEDFKYGRVTNIDDFQKELNQRIDSSEEDFELGRFTDSKDLIKKYTT